MDDDAPLIKFVVDAVVEDEGILGDDGFCVVHRVGLEKQHSAAALAPIACFGMMALSDKIFDEGNVGRDVLIEDRFIDDTFFNFDKPGHERFP